MRTPSASPDRSRLRTIARNAAPLADRILALGHTGRPQTDAAPDQAPSERLKCWEAAVAPDNPPDLAARLLLDGLDPVTAQFVLDAPMPEEFPLPSWAGVLAEVLDGTGPWEPIEESENPLPFVDAYSSLVQNAVGLLNRSGAPAAILRCSRQSLANRLTQLCELTLESEFNRFRPFGLNAAARFEDVSTERVHYLRFCGHLRDGGFADLFERYPALGRLAGVVIELWIAGTREFIDRFVADLTELHRIFGGGDDNTMEDQGLGELVRVQSGMSDPHRGARQVHVLTFSNQTRVVYKPRDTTPDVLWKNLIEWFGKFDQLLPLWHPQAMQRDGYGWIGYVPAADCADDAALRRYYVRAGMLLCLGFALQANDLHHENVLSTGEHPVLIDLETLFVPEPRVSRHVAMFSGTACHLDRSVLSTGLLPMWYAPSGGRAIDMSGFAPPPEAGSLDDRPNWRFINTDLMYRVMGPANFEPTRNTPVRNGVLAAADHYVTEIVEGFQAIYRVIIDHGVAMTAPEGPLAAFRGCSVRLIVRATAFYMRLSRASLAPRFLTSGADRSLRLEVLYWAWLLDPPVDGSWRIARSEISEMENLDIPYFSVENDTMDLRTHGGGPAIPRAFERSGWQRVCDQLAAMTEQDMLRQSGYIRTAYDARTAAEGKPESAYSRLQSGRGFEASEWIDRALSIAREIRREGLSSRRETNWIGLVQAVDLNRRDLHYELRLLPAGLWSGTAGIALFLAACYAMTGAEEFRETALAALIPARSQLTGTHTNPGLARFIARTMGVGGAEGLGALVLALVRTARFLGDSSLLTDAQAVAGYITPEAIAADEKLDVLLGSAGALLALLNLHEAEPVGEGLRKAVLCGDHLLATQRTDGAWPTAQDEHLFGFSHGAAGISYALARLYGATGEERYLVSALAGMKYEHGGLDRTRNNWPRLGNPQGRLFAAGWCHGAPGVGLARLGALPYCDGEDVREDISAAMRFVASAEDPGVDHICCGAFSHVEFLLAADDRDAATARASWLTAQADKHGGFRLFSTLPRANRNLGLGQGLAGIGYQMLRLAEPERFPSILLW